MRVCNVAGLVLITVTSTIIFIFAPQLIQIFTDDEEVIRIGVDCLRIIMPVQWSYVMTSTHLAMLQAVKKPMYGFFESVLRKVLTPLPLFWLFVLSYGYGINSVWYIIAATNVFMTVVTVAYAQVVLKKVLKD